MSRPVVETPAQIGAFVGHFERCEISQEIGTLEVELLGPIKWEGNPSAKATLWRCVHCEQILVGGLTVISRK